MRARSVVRRSDRPVDDQVDLARERAVGEPLYPQSPGELASTLRPQQSRNVVWRWHMRRRQRDG